MLHACMHDSQPLSLSLAKKKTKREKGQSKRVKKNTHTYKSDLRSRPLRGWGKRMAVQSDPWQDRAYGSIASIKGGYFFVFS